MPPPPSSFTVNMRPLILDVSALTPIEYTTYIAHCRALTETTADIIDLQNISVSRQTFRAFVVDRLRVPTTTADSVLHIYDAPDQLSSGRIFALLRLFAHEQRSSTPLDLNMVFLPVQPLVVKSPKSDPSALSRSSLMYPNGFGTHPSLSPSSSTVASNNPFRRRHVSQPDKAPPPLPPRKGSGPPQLPPRRVRAASSSTSTARVHANPTSIIAPSDIIRQSLLAANASTSCSDLSLHVIKKSPSERSVNAAEITSRTPHTIVQEVNTALRQADLDAQPQGFADISVKWRRQDPTITLWSCTDVLAEDCDTPPRYAMIIVNQPIPNRAIFRRAWRASRTHHCADGGANRLFDLFDDASRPHYLPTMIKGDLDSLRPDVRLFYESRGVPILQDRDEYSTDLMKCIAEVERLEAATQIPLLLIGGLSGRIDQTVHTISLLHRLRKQRPVSYVLSGESIAWVLDAGSHLIDIDHSSMGETCGLLPVGVDAAMVTTQGLKWNLGNSIYASLFAQADLQDWSTSFDGDVSTSNHLLPDEPVVFVKTDRPILWCIEVRGAVI